MTQPEIILLFIIITCIAAFIGGYCGFGLGIVPITFISFLPYDIKSLVDSVAINVFINSTALLLISKKNGKIELESALPIIAGSLISIPLEYKFIILFGNKE